MSTISSMNLGVQGINKGMNGLRQNASDIAGLNKTSPVDGGQATAPAVGVKEATDSLVDMKMNRLQVEMSAKVVQTSSDMIGTLLDVKA